MASEARIKFLDGSRIVTKAPPWHSAVTFDLFLSSIASGTFIVAAILFLLSPVRWAVPSTLGFGVALVFEIADLMSLVVDLGDPMRFHHMLRMLKFRSPMSLGVWLTNGLAFFAFLASVVSILIARGNLNLVGVLEIVAALGLVFAIGVSTYKGVLLSTTAQPVWKELRWLGADFSISAGACGATIMLAIATASSDFTGAIALRFVAGLLLVIYTVTVAITMRHINHALAPRTGRAEIIFWNVMAVIVGGALPAALAFLPWSFTAIDYVILACTLAGALAFKHALVMLPHRVGADS